MITYDDFLLLLEDVLGEVGHRLAERRAGAEGVGTAAQLDEIYRELAQLAGQVRAKALPAQDQRYLAAAYLVTDSWPPQEKLGERICMVDMLYRRQLE